MSFTDLAEIASVHTVGLPAPIGYWEPERAEPATSELAIADGLRNIGRPLAIIQVKGAYGLAGEGPVVLNVDSQPEGAVPVVAYVAPCPVEDLGDAGFRRELGLRYACLGGSMANGICSTAMLKELGRAGMLGFFGSAGLSVDAVETAIEELQTVGDHNGRAGTAEEGLCPYGFNLIHSPHDPALESSLVDLYLRRGIRLVEASAFLRLTLPLVRYRVHGIQRGEDGTLTVPNRVIAKVSRVELARKFFAPPPEDMLRELVARNEITGQQAELAAKIPVAQDITAEADSGGHTDGRPAMALFPTICAVRDKSQHEHGYGVPLRVGLAGGIATPAAAAAAFSMGAAYIMTGSINQACVESGTSETVRQMLAEAGQADTAMAPSADMFEAGVKVQVLKRGTMFAMRASRLYEIYRKHDSLDAIPAEERAKLEKTVFRAPLDEIWKQTENFFRRRNSRELDRAAEKPKHKMALVFRWYLGKASHWANEGEPSRKVDYQVWCGPSIGAFNEWVGGSYLEKKENRRVSVVARNILYGAAVLTRLSQLGGQGIGMPPGSSKIDPLEPAQLEEYFC